MYILEFEKIRPIKQMELSDFFSNSRKLYFDMKIKKEAKFARKHLKPRGLRKRKYKKHIDITKENQKLIFTNSKLKLTNNIPKSNLNIKKKKVKTFSQAEIKFRKIENFKKKQIGIKEEKNENKKNVNEENVNEENVNEEKIKNNINKKKKIVKKKEKAIKKEDLSITNKKIQSKEKINEINEKSIENKYQNKQLVEDDIISEFGTDGKIEITCPICEDIVCFNYDDIDGTKLKNTRICSCDTIFRLSISGYQRKIFDDFKIKEKNPDIEIKRVRNDIIDEFDNIIYSYIFRNLY